MSMVSVVVAGLVVRYSLEALGIFWAGRGRLRCTWPRFLAGSPNPASGLLTPRRRTFAVVIVTTAHSMLAALPAAMPPLASNAGSRGV